MDLLRGRKSSAGGSEVEVWVKMCGEKMAVIAVGWAKMKRKFFVDNLGSVVDLSFFGRPGVNS